MGRKHDEKQALKQPLSQIDVLLAAKFLHRVVLDNYKMMESRRHELQRNNKPEHQRKIQELMNRSYSLEKHIALEWLFFQKKNYQDNSVPFWHMRGALIKAVKYIYSSYIDTIC